MPSRFERPTNFMFDSLNWLSHKKRKKLKQSIEHCSNFRSHASSYPNNVCNLGNNTLSPFVQRIHTNLKPVISDRLINTLRP
ncbi:hypothetical protein M3Y95_00235400 [Aphelenchoides besseyi]|nr:hypothetical protein M3Y95_00235400 [Aphelenchoides besseyi]